MSAPTRRTTTGVPNESDVADVSASTPFDAAIALDELLTEVGLSRPGVGGSVTFAGEDPILPAAHRLGACIGVPLMAAAVAAVTFHRHRGGPVRISARPAPSRALHQSRRLLASDPQRRTAPHPLLFDNPFTVIPYRTARRPLGHGLGGLPAPGRKMVPLLGRAPRYHQSRRSDRDVGRLRTRRKSQRTRAAHQRRPYRRRVGGARTGSAAGLPTGHRPQRIGDAPVRDFGRRRGRSTASACCRSPTPSPVQPWAERWPSKEPTCSVPPDPTTTSTTSSTPRPTSGPEAPTSTWPNQVEPRTAARFLGERRHHRQQLPHWIARAPRTRPGRLAERHPGIDVGLGHLLRPEWSMGAVEEDST